MWDSPLSLRYHFQSLDDLVDHRDWFEYFLWSTKRQSQDLNPRHSNLIALPSIAQNRNFPEKRFEINNRARRSPELPAENEIDQATPHVLCRARADEYCVFARIWASEWSFFVECAWLPKSVLIFAAIVMGALVLFMVIGGVVRCYCRTFLDPYREIGDQDSASVSGLRRTIIRAKIRLGPWRLSLGIDQQELNFSREATEETAWNCGAPYLIFRHCRWDTVS